MPLINGLKMACEPCIRGHRSTKCTHANERLMVPVRKPGRPLSTCPHPASRPCSCGQVTAAIPRKQKCHCGPDSTESPQVKTEDSESSKDTTPQSPSKATNPSYRVQKTTSKNGVQPSSRRQSVDPVALERMDPNMLNIMPPYAGVPQKPPVPMPDISAFGAMGMVSADTPFGPMVYPMFPPHMPPPMLSPDTPNGMTNGHSSTLTNGHAPNKADKPALKVGSCCGGGGSNGVASLSPTTQSPTVSSPTVPSEKKTKSCCSSGITSPKTELKPIVVPVSDVPTPNGIIMSPFQTPVVMPNGMYPYYPQPTIFTYPPQYGSYLQPLQPEQWRQVMASMTFAAPGAMPAPYAIPATVPYQPQGPPHSAASTSHSAAGTSHQCTCGEGCQCVGCAAHPYNEATQNYVRSAWESMLDEPQSAGGHAHGDHGHTHVNGHRSNGSSTPNESSNPDALPVVGSAEGTKSPPAPQTPSDAASGMSDEQALSASDFFFVSYPFGDSCVGEMSSCPCGEDCQCLGCAIHDTQIPGLNQQAE
ncbi:hypothetical protein G7Z17_g12663 [Cylindrodendrum hubeiense]|uniref:Copper-fist domain-containing protein n=1 Tax=Cylindrodendrum hubeiense TaxID=595255 RepID=A0A9P5GTL9_9HYPO|nr:hypothetical protein G7Z17_g12663 [Cylindrodendrum hubeiense]